MSYADELENLVNEIHTKVAAVKQAGEDADRARTTHQLPGDLGMITVAGSGELVEVALDVPAMKAYTATSLAQQLLRGIHAAERDAHAQRDAMMALAQQKARIV
ncbi:hypothetical protein [Amycolatopsis sp. H20-H5]|uniref:hypothetical protein n=1 Tax=Amycolatopsis sp. H20-H5 TaxID=3046309 RepID=UPI002DBE98D0|nr:hypothetical protein [Amycolatopsis sp. H20-H5]MEC3980855.1 hypothetical protein [Amycolatopsis sp. H20-H5]